MKYNIINVSFVAKKTYELSMMNPRKRVLKDEEIFAVEVKPKMSRLDVKSASDSNGMCMVFDFLFNSIS